MSRQDHSDDTPIETHSEQSSQDATPPEFSHLITVSALPSSGRVYEFQLEPDILETLARRFKIPSVDDLKASLCATPTLKGVIVEGSFSAKLTRECVVSLETMKEDVADEFRVEFDRTAKNRDDEALLEEGVDLLAEPEPLAGDILDVGELLIQQLSLAMAPFPRKPGAKSLVEIYGHQEEPSPFAVLKQALSPDKTKKDGET